MSYTYVTNIGDGVTRSFPFSFAGQDTGYLAVSNISVYLAGNLVSNYEIKPSSPNVVTFTDAPPLGAEILIRRIMPKQVPYTDFSRGNTFSQDSLNNTNLQMLYLIQEIYDGYLPSGFYFRVDIDMRGKKLINLGDGVNDGDSVNMKQFKVEVTRNNSQDSRLTSLEDNITAGQQANFFAQLYIATGGETTVDTINNLFCAALYIDGLYQHKIAGAYKQVGGVITLAEPLRKGQEVYLILGTSLPSDSLYATIESVQSLYDIVDGINSLYAKKGANSDITSLSGLTTPLSLQQGGNGNSVGRSATATKLDVPRGVRINLASGLPVNFDGSTDISPGVMGVLSIANGGTGNISGKAVALSTPRNFQINLASNVSATFDGSADVNPGVTGILPRSNGGTGQSDVSYLSAADATTVSITSGLFTKLSPTVVNDTKTAYSAGDWTCPVTGYYQITGSARFGTPATKTCVRALKIDSSTSPTSTTINGQSVLVSAGDADTMLQTVSTLYLTAGTKLSLYCFHSDTANLNVIMKSLQVIRVA